MFTKPDDTYNNIRKRSYNQWLDEMEQHKDIAVRGGVRLAREYMAHLEEEIEKLKDECKLKDTYLKKMTKR